jgi:hypothetical protein
MFMNLTRKLLRAMISLVVAIPAFAIAGGQDEHHPPSASATAKKAEPTESVDGKAKMDAPMKAMREMHEKMMSVKTPEERQALMADHMKAMRDGMAMMNGMMGDRTPGKAPIAPDATQKQMDMMRKQMDMMQAMMQMMMDRLETPGPAK